MRGFPAHPPIGSRGLRPPTPPGVTKTSWLLVVALVALTGCAQGSDPGLRGVQSAPAAQAAPKHITLAILGDLPSLYTAINPAGTTRGQEIITDSLNANLAHRD